MADGRAQKRGRGAVEEALLDAAGELLAEHGPARVSVRDIAARAGVNKGQIHHYFGGKRGLLEAAFRKLAADYLRATIASSGASHIPPPLALDLDQRFMQALIRLVLDGDLETAGLAFDEELSVPHRALAEIAARRGLDEADLELKSAFAAVMILDLGWAAFGEFVLRAVDSTDDEVDSIKAYLRETMARLVRA